MTLDQLHYFFTLANFFMLFYVVYNLKKYKKIKEVD